jgi:hypothetical protein
VCILMRLYKWNSPRLTWRFIRMPLLDLSEFVQLTDFLIQEQAQLTKQLLPKIWPRYRTWYGPGDLLEGLTFAEWIDAEAAVFSYRQTKKECYLNRLVAVLYRPGQQAPNPATGDRRPPYVQHELEARSEQAARLSIDVRRAILVYYDGCRQFYINNYPEVFSVGDDDEPQADKTPTSPAPAYLRILRDLAGSPDRFEVMGQQPVGNIFFDLSERVKQVEAREKQLEDQRSQS